MSIKQLLIIFILVAVATISPKTNADPENTILMVVTSHGEDQGETRPGYEIDEFAKAYLIFKQNGYQIEVASPKGGPVEADKYDPEKPYNQLLLADKEIMQQLSNTLTTAAVKDKDYAAIFVVGGKGAMFDLPWDTNLQSLVANLYENDRVVSAVCHGPAAFVDVKLSNGDYLVAGKRVNGFTNQEEGAFGKKWLPEFKFLLEDKLIERGAKFESASMMLSHVAIDGNLITAQNPYSTTDAALAIVKKLGKQPLPHKEFQDDTTVAAIARVMSGDQTALKEIGSADGKYQIELAGIYGYYLIDHTNDKGEINYATQLMEAANVTMQHPVLKMSIIKGYQKQGKTSEAIAKARLLAKEMPDNDNVKALLASLETDQAES